MDHGISIKCIGESFPRVLSSLPLMCHGLSDLGSPILICIIMKCTYDLSHVNETQSAMGRYGTALTWTPGAGALGISGWGCAAGTLEPLTYTRASSAEFCYPILE